MMKEKNTNLQIDILVNSPPWDELPFDPQTVAEKVIPLALEEARNNTVLPEALTTHSLLEISIMLSAESEVRRLNKQYRNKDKSTNILSFSGIEDFEDQDPFLTADESPLHLGDLILCYQTVAREVREMGIPFKDHFIHLLVHGTLHILGYDHIEDDEAEEMESLEIAILKKLGIKNPYALDKFVA